MTIPKNLKGEKLTKEDLLVLKYEGSSFDNKMELHSFTKQITSVERILREVVDTLNIHNKITDSSKSSKYYLELHRGSFETTISILFINPITLNLVSNCIYDYFKYLVDRKKSKKYSKEITKLVEDKSIRRYTKDILAPCVSNSDKVTIIQGDVKVNRLIINQERRDKIDDNLKKIEDKLPVEEFEEELIGQIRKIDATKNEDLSKSKLGFIIEGNSNSIDINFKKEIKEEELRKIIFKRLKIKGKATYRGEEIIKIIIYSYDFSPKKKITDYE